MFAKRREVEKLEGDIGELETKLQTVNGKVERSESILSSIAAPMFVVDQRQVGD